jgi:hypothetical protein
MAGIDRAPMHAHIDTIKNRFTNDLTLIGLGILILAPIKVSYGGGGLAGAKSPLCFRDSTNERGSHSLNDSRRSTDGYENGMKTAGSVMKAAGSVITVRMHLSASNINARAVAQEGLLLNVSRDGARKRN